MTSECYEWGEAIDRCDSEFCISNEKLCINNEEFYIDNDESCSFGALDPNAFQYSDAATTGDQFHFSYSTGESSHKKYSHKTYSHKTHSHKTYSHKNPSMCHC